MKRIAYISPDFKAQTAQWLFRATHNISQRHELVLNPDTCALVVVDMNHYFTHPEGHCYLPAAAAVIPQIAQLLSFWRANNHMIIYTRHGHRGPADAGMFGKFFNGYIESKSAGAQIINALAPLAHEIVIDKNTYDSFHNTPLAQQLRSHHITQVLVCGVLTHMCVETTARSAFCHGFECYVAVDAVAADNEENHQASLCNMAQTCAVLDTAEGFLAKMDTAGEAGL